MSKVKAAVFASGTGSNFQAIIDNEKLPCEVELLVCDKPEAKVIEKAIKVGVETFVFQAKDYPTKVAYETDIVNALKERNISWIFLAGYMRLVGTTLLDAYEGKIVNIHPSFLPAFPGKDAIGQAFHAGVTETGVTVHFVDEGMDSGPIIAQEVVPVFAEDTMETLENRIHKVEHQLYPKVIQQLVESEGY